MKKILTTLLLGMFLTNGAFPQVFPVDTLQTNGDMTKLINIVILPDGYTAAELDKFKTDAANFLSYFFSTAPLSAYKNYFNAYCILVPSNESGAKHPRTAPDCTSMPYANPDNYFGSTFDAYGIHRLLVANNTTAIYGVLSSNLPSYDLVMILVNTTEYGGSGGSFAVASLNSSSDEIALHEMGHTFSYLGDEYWAGSQYASEAPNRTQEWSPVKVKWSEWLNIDNVGIYQYTEDTTWHRPHQNCKMRILNKDFCRVCQEAFIEQIHTKTDPIYSYVPSSSTLETALNNLNFSLTTLKPIPNTLKIAWTLDSKVVASNLENYMLPANSMNEGAHTLMATVIDTTGSVKIPSHFTTHLYTVEWTIQKSTGIVEVVSNQYVSQVAVFPNPFNDELQVMLQFQKPTQLTIDLLDAGGSLITTLYNQPCDAGEYIKPLSVSSLHLPDGIYLLRFTADGTTFSKPVFKTH